MKNLSTDLQALFADGVEKVQILADFDGTLTKEYVDGQKTPSLISILRNEPGYLSSEYQAAAHQLSEHYKPLEHDTNIDLGARKEKMTEWWTKHKQLLIDSGIRLEHLQRLAQSEFIQWREGAVDFLALMKKLNIPVVILSASGIGEVIPLYCKAQNVDSPNMHYIVNQFIWNEQGRAIGFHQPIIHSLNKDETAVKSNDEVFQAIKDRPNILLLGNSLGDLGMSNGYDIKNISTIGFLDQEELGRFPEFEKAFDHVIVKKGYTEINKQVLEILNQR